MAATPSEALQAAEAELDQALSVFTAALRKIFAYNDAGVTGQAYAAARAELAQARQAGEAAEARYDAIEAQLQAQAGG